MRDAELVFVAAPISVLSRAIDEALAAAPAGCVVTDVGSTKRELVGGCEDARFIGGHPLAGAETAGVEHARADLFAGATWYLTPGPATSGELYERLHKTLAGIGATPTAIDAAEHDLVMASVSHLPHVFANVLVAQAAHALGDGERPPATGPSFRDATRVAGASPTIWPDIYLSNREALVAQIDETQSRLAEVRSALVAADRPAIGKRWNEEARADREALLGAGLAGGAVYELRAAVADRPGAVAEIALALGRAGINAIVDIALSPARDGHQGDRCSLDCGRGGGAARRRNDHRARDPGRARMIEARFDPARRGLQGVLVAPPDKSFSHRSAILGAACDGTLRVSNYLRAADTDATLDAVRALGAEVQADGSEVTITGVGLRGAREPAGVIDVRNSGTLMRLLPGWLAGQEGRRFPLDGDESIRRRPIDRIAVPLREMGAQLEAERLPPFTVVRTALYGITYVLPVASAQVKSCVLLAGLLASGETTVVEPEPSRDHTERMLLRAGVTMIQEGSRITVTPSSPAPIDRLVVPGDPSSAAFWVAAAPLVGGSHVIVEGVGANWTRNGFVQIARRMGASVEGEIETPGAPLRAEDPITTLEVRSAPLRGTIVEAGEVPLAIDELPLVALLGVFAEGETVVMRGAGTAGQGIGPDRDCRRRPALARRRDRGDGRRLRCDRDWRSGGRHDQLARRPSPRDARRDRGPRLEARRRGAGHGRGARLLPDVHRRPGAPRDVIIAIDGPAGAGKSSNGRAGVGDPARLPLSRQQARCIAPSRSRALPLPSATSLRSPGTWRLNWARVFSLMGAM